jgi:peptide/nickel transport system permease protein
MSLLVFSLQYIVPGGSAYALAGPDATPESVAAVTKSLGLDRPFLERYLEWVGHLLQGDFGTSNSTRQPVIQVISDRLPATVELVGGALLIALLVGVLSGAWAAVHRGRAQDRVVLFGSGLGLSVPDFWAAALGAGVFGLSLGLVPAVGFMPVGDGLGANLHSVILPMLVLSLHSAALISRHVRSAMVLALDAPHARTAWALGVAPRRLYIDDGFRLAISPLITFLPLVVASVVGASVVVERVFDIPGLGTAIVESVLARDYPVLQGLTMILALTVVLLNLVGDLVLVVIDPRIRRGTK